MFGFPLRNLNNKKENVQISWIFKVYFIILVLANIKDALHDISTVCLFPNSGLLHTYIHTYMVCYNEKFIIKLLIEQP